MIRFTNYARTGAQLGFFQGRGVFVKNRAQASCIAGCFVLRLPAKRASRARSAREIQLGDAVSSPRGLGSSPGKIWDFGHTKRLETAFPALHFQLLEALQFSVLRPLETSKFNPQITVN